MHNLISWKHFLRDESGQTTTEYVLILLVVVTLIMNMKTKLLKILGVLFGGLDKGVDKAINFDDVSMN